jgi:hypothetical protein
MRGVVVSTEHRKAYVKKWKQQWQQKRKARIHELLGGKCVVCGATESLEAHHKDPAQKSFNVTAPFAWHRILAELEKCELLCSECHYDKHGRTGHGKLSMYRRYKCRCELCKRAYAEYRRNYCCTEEYRAWEREWRRKKRESDPTVRERHNRQERERRKRRNELREQRLAVPE